MFSFQPEASSCLGSDSSAISENNQPWDDFIFSLSNYIFQKSMFKMLPKICEGGQEIGKFFQAISWVLSIIFN